MKRVNRVTILGAPVDCLDMITAIELVEAHIRESHSTAAVLAVNPEKVYALRDNQFLADFFAQSAILIPDGIGVVLAMRLKGYRAARVPGADLMQEICALAAVRGYRIFIYGAKEDVNRGAVERLRERLPSLQIVGRANGYVKEEDMAHLVAQINESKAEILFVALGSPRQEEWMDQHLGQLQAVRICQGIGGTLDAIVGSVKRAPVVMQMLNLEWLFRLVQQPTRARRQVKLLRFVWEIGMDKARALLVKRST
jgi:N-acetylglucosaminyldiphosphoundecaprenol N-acetyl-beta-D-mannosaminyltransferase